MTTTQHNAWRGALAFALFAASLTALPAAAQVQDAAQQKCIKDANIGGGKLAATQGKADITCVKNAASGKEPDATACLTADTGGKVAAAAAKVTSAFNASCTKLPDFGPSSAATTSDAARNQTVAMATDIFGSNVTAALVTSAANTPAAKCQAAVIGNAQKIADEFIKDFNTCKIASVKKGTTTSTDGLSKCLATVNADAKAKLANAATKLRDTVSVACTGLDLATLLPGACPSFSNPVDCVIARARCRACSVVATGDNVGDVCDRFDDGLPSNSSCGAPLITTTRISLPAGAQPVHTPGSTGVVVTNTKLLTQFPPSGPDLNRADYVRWRLSGPDVTPDVILILVPGFGSGVNPLRTLAENLIPKVLSDKGLRLEVWAFARRDDRLEDRAGVLIAMEEQDPAIAQDWYYGAELGLTLHPSLVAGPNRRAIFYDSHSDIPFLADFTPQVFARDMNEVVNVALAVTPNVFLGGHSAGTSFAARYASTDFNLSGIGAPDPGYAKLRGLVLLEGGGGTTAASDPLSSDTLDRIIAKADGGLFGAVRDNADRCVDGVTACTIATEAIDCVGQVPPKCTPAATSYTSIGGLQPQIYAAGEVGAVQAMKDPETGQVILQVDQGAVGNNAIDKVPGLSLLKPPTVPKATVQGLFGLFLDDDELNATVLSPALATSLGTRGGFRNGLLIWKDIYNDGPLPPSVFTDNGPKPTSLPAGHWGKEVEVSRIDRHIFTFIADGQNASDWYYAGSGLSTLGVTGQCNVSVAGICTALACTVGGPGACATNSDCNIGTCTVGKSGSCKASADCSQAISLDSTALSVGRGRRDIANLTQAANIDIPVISFGGSNGLAPVGAAYLPFGQSIGVCTRPGCNGTPRVIDAALPNPAFPTYGDVAGGYEVYISEGYAHVDVVTAEDTIENQIPERIEDFLARNVVP